MAVLILDSGALMVTVKHIQRKSGSGVWYFRRRVPEDVRHRYPIGSQGRKGEFMFSLKTKSEIEAGKKAHSLAREQDAYWKSLRDGEAVYGKEEQDAALAYLAAHGLKPGDAKRYRADEPGLDPFWNALEHEAGIEGPESEPEPLPPVPQLALDLFKGRPLPKTLSDARRKHFELGLGPKGEQALGQFENAWNRLLRITGDVAIESVSREQANAFVAGLVEDGLAPTTIKRYLAQVSPVMKTGLREFEIARENVFSGLVIPNRDTAPPKPRYPFSDAEIRSLQSICRRVDDERRWAISVLSDTGARLAEIIGLDREDVILTGIPHIQIRANQHRRLKQKEGSTRIVPLVGEALWAIQRAMDKPGSVVFPVFFDAKGKLRADVASATLNKWMKDQKVFTERGKVLHSFRHSMQDRLRNAGVPEEVRDRLIGWKREGTGALYGKGFSLEVLAEHMQKIVLAGPE